MVINLRATSARPELEYSASSIGINYEYAASPSFEKMAEWLDVKTALQTSMIEGYQTMSAENLELAEGNISLAIETWS